MAVVNGRIKIKKVAKSDKKEVVKKKSKADVREPKAEKKQRPAPAADVFRIATGEHGFLSVDLVEDEAGQKVIAFRKWFNTKKDAEIKPARGGFNMQPKASELKILAKRLRDLAQELDAEE